MDLMNRTDHADRQCMNRADDTRDSDLPLPRETGPKHKESFKGDEDQELYESSLLLDMNWGMAEGDKTIFENLYEEI